MLVHQALLRQILFALGALLGQNMALIRMLTFNAPRARQREPLRSGLVRLHLWHPCPLLPIVIL